MHVAGARHRKTCTNKSQLVLVLLLVGWNSGTSSFEPIVCVVVQKQIIFDTQWKPLILLLIMVFDFSWILHTS